MLTKNRYDCDYTNNTLRKGRKRMPLTLAEDGEQNVRKRIGGRQDNRAHWENLGFVVGSTVTVISAIGGNVIVHVKESRIAISREMAQKIIIFS